MHQDWGWRPQTNLLNRARWYSRERDAVQLWAINRDSQVRWRVGLGNVEESMVGLLQISNRQH